MIIAVANQKGGVCKTTTVLGLSDSLRRQGKSVLVVDLDQQANATRSYGIDSVDGVASAYDVLMRGIEDVCPAIQSTPCGDIVPGDIALASAEASMASMVGAESTLRAALAPVAGGYDFILVDCPPALGIVTRNALVAADRVLVPLLADPYSVDGLDKLSELIDSVRRYSGNPGLSILGLLLCQYHKDQRLSESMRGQLPALAERYGARAFETPIRHRTAVPQAQAARAPLAGYSKDSGEAAADYDAVAAELLAAIEGEDD